jgi:hypothetical protein
MDRQGVSFQLGGLCVGQTTPHHKKLSTLWINDLSNRVWTWNIQCISRAGTLVTVLRELSRYKLDFMGVQEVGWESSGTEPAGEYTFFYGKGNQNQELGIVFFCT